MENNIQIITFTQSAVEEIKRLQFLEKNQYIRVGVKGGGCSGLTYILEKDTPIDDDEIFEINGILCCMKKSHKIYLYGMEIDWQNGLQNRGFVFKNPNASKTCGCGTSFSV